MNDKEFEELVNKHPLLVNAVFLCVIIARYAHNVWCDEFDSVDVITLKMKDLLDASYSRSGAGCHTGIKRAFYVRGSRKVHAHETTRWDGKIRL